MKYVTNLYSQTYTDTINFYLAKPIVQQMSTYMQHGSTTTLEHVGNVAKTSFIIN